MAKRNFGQAIKDAAASDPRGSQRTEDAPAGTHIASCVFTDVKPTNAGDKHRLILRFVVDTGPHTGKGGWNSQTLDPTSDVSMRIFGKLCEALGVPADELEQFDPDKPEDVIKVLHYVAEKARGSRNEIKVVPANNNPDKTEIKYVNKLPKNAPPPQKQQAASAMAKVAAATTAKPAATVKPAAKPGPKRPAL